jgi:hypothetical protein
MDGGSAGAGDPAATVSLAELEAEITELAGQLNAAQFRWLTLIGEFDRRQGWADGRLASCAHWLNFKCGLNLGAAREKVRVAHALTKLPKIAASMARGELSYSKVRALTRVACAATEDNLLMIALHGTAHHVESIVSRFRRALDADQLSREARQHAERGLTYAYDEDGSLVIKARLPAVEGALLIKALEAAMQELPATELRLPVGEEQPSSFQSRRADALAHLAASFLQRRAKSSPGSADRYQVVLHVDASTFAASLEDGPALPAETARRLACDSSRIEILKNARGELLDVGRKRRSIPPAIRRALNARDTGCRFPGCTYRRYLDAHHVEHWADGGETRLDNLVSLCRWHHRLVHEGGIRVEERAGGGWRFLRPDGREFDPRPLDGAAPAVHRAGDLQRHHEAQGVHIDSQTAVTRWRGERADYELGVWVLCQQAGRVAAETSAPTV